MSDARRPLLLLVNPVAGGKPASPTTEHPPLEPDEMREQLEGHGLTVRLHVLAEGDDAGALARDAVREGRDVAVAGGDGTVRPVAAALVGSESTLGVVPRGSWNNIATGWGLPREEPDALQVIAAGAPRLVDAGLAWHAVSDADDEPPPPNAATFFEAAGVGLDAAGFGAVAVGDRYGIWRAVRAAWRALRRRRTGMLLTVDGRRRRTSAPAVTACNGPHYGFGFSLAPQADPADGELDLIVFSGMTTFDVLRHYLAVARNRPRREPRVQRLAARRIKVVGRRRGLPAHADGEPIGTTPVIFAVQPRALQIFGGAGQAPGSPVAAAASPPKTRA
ncbi:MAG TPA: diacylglycerol kinase family protein [Candidatus Limnocylindria bacterium]|jgi:diacylglycerol kinase family enzyme